MSALDTVLADLGALGDRLERLLAPLPEAGWRTPTPAAGWDVATQIAAGDRRIIGVMVESNLVAGRQDLVPGAPLTYGQSITDGCIGWDTTVESLEGLAKAVSARRAKAELVA